MRINIYLFILLIGLSFSCRMDLIDTKQSKFIPAEMAKNLEAFEKFDVGLWNYIVLNSSEIDICPELRMKFSSLIKQMICRPDLTENKEYILSYLKSSFVLFAPPKSNEIDELLANNLTVLGMPLGPEGPALIELLRNDPFDFKSELMKKISSFEVSGFEWSDGYLKDLESQRRIIPIRLNYSAHDISKTKILLDYLKTNDATIIGRYSDFYSNQSQVEADLSRIGIVSVFLLLIASFFLIKYKVLSVLITIIPSLVGIVFGLIFTIFSQGSIHGLTISFGVGIIGLSMDYAIHLFFSKNKKEVQRSNVFGLLTTLAVFITFSFSSIPLIREMMIFSCVGLIVSFICTSLLFKNRSFRFQKSLNFSISSKHFWSLKLAILGLLLIGALNYDFNIRRFNYVSKDVSSIQNWFYQKWGDRKLYFKTYEKNSDEIESDYFKLKDTFPVGENVFKYLPSSGEMDNNLEKWETFGSLNIFNQAELEIYQPFLSNLNSFNLTNILNQKFLSNLVSESQVISLWFVDRKELSNQKFELKGSVSLEDSLIKASKVLFNELKLFVSITIFSIFLILFLRKKSIKYALLCLIPFLFSLGCLSIIFYVFKLPVTFMSLIGLLILYGISVDYGIFSTDFYLNENENDLNTSLLLSWCSSFIGFFPLVYCAHNVMLDLGLVVVIGLFGIFYSTFFILPACIRWRHSA